MSNMYTWYSVYYGSWAKNDSVKHVTQTYSRKKAFEAARETARRTGETVTVCGERGTGYGLRSDFTKIEPDGTELRI